MADSTGTRSGPRAPMASGELALGAVVAATTVLFALAVVEVAFRWLVPVPDPYERFKTPAGAVNQYIKSEFTPNFRLRTFVESGLPGMTGGSHWFSTNNVGFRGGPLRRPKPADEIRIFMIGGSTTECLYLDDSESIDRVLQDNLNVQPRRGAVARVYNAGKSGDATDDHISMMVHRIVHLEPDVVVVFAGANDLTRSIYGYDPLHFPGKDTSGVRWDLPTLVKMTATEFQVPRRLHYLVTRHSSRTPTQILEEIRERSDYREKAALRKAAPAARTPPRVDLESYRRNLRTLAGVSRAHGITLVFMTQQSTWNGPDSTVGAWHWTRYRDGVTYPEQAMDEALESMNDVMREVAAAGSIPIYDLARVLPKTSEFFYDDLHFNVGGARAAGRGLASFMIAQSVLTPSRAAP